MATTGIVGATKTAALHLTSAVRAFSRTPPWRCGPACAGRAAQRQSPALTPGQRRAQRAALI
jgi:hypothetical protein